MSIQDWLESIYLEEYIPLLLTAGYDTLDKCASLTSEKLDVIGITRPGHKVRILKHIPELPASDPVYENVASDVDKDLACAMDGCNETDSTKLRNSGRMSSAGVEGESEVVEDDEIYDVPPCRQPLGSEEAEDDEIYVNAAEVRRQSMQNEEVPPSLPPKLTPKRPSSEISPPLGIASLVIAHKEGVKWKPVPTPRKTISAQKAKPTPPPRLKSRRTKSLENTNAIFAPEQTLGESMPSTPTSKSSMDANGSSSCDNKLEHGDKVEPDHKPVSSSSHVRNLSVGDVNTGAAAVSSIQFLPLPPLPFGESSTDSPEPSEADDLADNTHSFCLDDSHPAASADNTEAAPPHLSTISEEEANRVNELRELGRLKDKSDSVETSSSTLTGVSSLSSEPSTPLRLSSEPSSPLRLSVGNVDGNHTDEEYSVPKSLTAPPQSLEEEYSVPKSLSIHSSQCEEEYSVPQSLSMTSAPESSIDVPSADEVIYDSVPNEELYTDVKQQLNPPPSFDNTPSPEYQPVWFWRTGSAKATSSFGPPARPSGSILSDDTSLHENPQYEQHEPKDMAADSVLQPPLLGPLRLKELQAGSRDTIVSFHEPHPNYPPPPLPPGVEAEEPPKLPPRPKFADDIEGNSRSSTLEFSDFVVQRVAPSAPPKTRINSFGKPVSGDGAKISRPPDLPPFQNVHFEPTNFGSSPETPPPPPPPRPSKDTSFLNHRFDLDEESKLDRSIVCESDDTLSDGGEFYQEPVHQIRPESLHGAVPIVPASPGDEGIIFQGAIHMDNVHKTREGYLEKHAHSGVEGQPFGWRKYWVTFDGNVLKYFSKNTSKVSKRIIPVESMLNVEQIVKPGESRQYKFKIITTDRMYTFGCTESDDLAMWTSVLMTAIINKKPLIEGGIMSSPDKEGFVRMEGVKGRRYLVVKGELLCYYNKHTDYKVASPIHMVEMKLASVKELGRLKLQLITPYTSYVFIFDSVTQMNAWKEIMQVAIAEGLGDDTVEKEVYINHTNRLCADCGAPDPHWSSVNIGITICKHCAGIHRMLQNPRSKVRSLRMDNRVWTPSLIQLLVHLGNEKANNFWEWNSTGEDRIDSDETDMDVRREYIVAKYTRGRFCRLHPLHTDPKALNEALCKSVQFGDILETMQLLFSGADLAWSTNNYGGHNETALDLAKKAKQTLQLEFLYQNGADDPSRYTIALSRTYSIDSLSGNAHLIQKKGFLSVSHKGEFHKRWAVLERGTLSYYENDRSPIAKESIERCDMMSIAGALDERGNEMLFEVGTVKNGGRTFVFAAETAEDRNNWVLKLTKSLAPLPAEIVEKLRAVDRAGVIFLRDGATKDWHSTWIHLYGKTLSIFKKDEQTFDEIDLRKITGIKSLHRNELCLEAMVEGTPFVIDLPNRALYIQGNVQQETDAWLETLQKMGKESQNQLSDQQLTSDNVPVVVDKCISFVATFGLSEQGIYRLSGQHSKVSALLEQFRSDARAVHLSLEEYGVHDVATGLKRYLRQLDEPLLTTILYEKWINTAAITDYSSKMQWYKYLLGELPLVHYNTFKRLISHLARVTEHDEENKMTVNNVASIFGPILLNTERDGEVSEGYKVTTQEINVLQDLLSCHQWLFELKDDELEHEQRIQEALKKIEQAKTANLVQAGDLLLGIYILNSEGDCVTLKVPSHMTCEDLLEYVVGKQQLDTTVNWGLFEVIIQGQLERPLHYLEKVLEVTMRWMTWPSDFAKDNYLCVKPNYVFENVEIVFDPQYSLFSEVRFSEKKGWKKYFFEFNQFKLSYHKDTRALVAVASWNVEDLVIYINKERKRSPPTEWCLTFIETEEKVVKSRDQPFFGHSMCFNNNEELYRWLAAMLHAQHPDGLSSKGKASHITGNSQLQQPPGVPDGAIGGAVGGASPFSQSPSSDSSFTSRNKSIFQRLKIKK